MKISEITVNSKDFTFDILKNNIAVEINDLYEVLSRKTDNFIVDGIDAFSPDDREEYLSQCQELFSIINAIYDSEDQSFKIVAFLLKYLTGQ